MKINHITIKNDYDFGLDVMHFEPNESKQKVLLINSAMAVEKKYYQKFGEYFANLGYDVYTYNYRGIGKNRPKDWKGGPISLWSWFEKDFDALLTYVLNNHSSYKKFVIGHSLGGQMIGCNPKINQFDSAVLVASGVGYWKNYNFPNNLRMFSYFHLFFPLLSYSFGYFPFSKFGGGEDLPKNVALEWAKWCRSKNYMFDFVDKNTIEAYKKIKIPLLHYSFSDDNYCERNAALELQKYYPTHIEDKFLNPQDLGIKNIGHFGFFKPYIKDILWKELETWFDKSN